MLAHLALACWLFSEGGKGVSKVLGHREWLFRGDATPYGYLALNLRHPCCGVLSETTWSGAWRRLPMKGPAMLNEIWTTIISEFSDIPDLSTMTRIVVRLMLAAILGGIVGYERERKARSAGVRTHMLVAVGAALFVLGPLQSGMGISDMSRVVQGIVQGVGFLGAGAIIIRAGDQKVEGLTTAATIWATAGIGVVVGLGLEATAVLSTFILLTILAVVPFIVPSADQDDTNHTEGEIK